MKLRYVVKPAVTVLMLALLIAICLSCEKGDISQNMVEDLPAETPDEPTKTETYPKIASWLAKKDEVIASDKPYSLVMAGYFDLAEAEQLRSANPDIILLAGLTVNWVLENADWKQFLETIASHGMDGSAEISDAMYLQLPDGSRCAFGWASDEWGHEEIYAMDPRNSEWISLITRFYETTMDLPQHDGIIVDMVTERSWCPDSITNEEWVNSTRAIMTEVTRLNAEDKLVVLNAGKEYVDIDAYNDYMDGYLMENFLGEWGADYQTGLEAANSDHLIIYAVDTDDTGVQDLHRMRLGLTLSLLNDNTYFTYDFGPRDHGQAWWFPEYDVDLGRPVGEYYEKDAAYRREFEKGTVVSSPDSFVNVSFENIHMDATTGIRGISFQVDPGDGRIFLDTEQRPEVTQKLSKGVSLSPRSYEQDDFRAFFDEAKDTGDIIMWAGDIEEFGHEAGAPRTLAELASVYQYVPLFEATCFDQSTGEPVRPMNAVNRQRYKEQTEMFVRKYEPAYIGFGIEVNTFWQNSWAEFDSFLVLYHELFNTVKSVSAETKVFTVFQLEMMKGLSFWETAPPNLAGTQWEMIDEFDTDIVAFTTYPGLVYKDPSDIPSDYYSEIADRTSKPIAFTEIGWHSAMSPEGWESSEEEQAEFVNTFFSLIQDLDVEITIWSFLYDQGVIEPFDSMGLRRDDGTVKESWHNWIKGGNS